MIKTDSDNLSFFFHYQIEVILCGSRHSEKNFFSKYPFLLKLIKWQDNNHDLNYILLEDY